MNEAERIAAFYKKHGVEPPKSFPHGTDEDIRANMERLRPDSWRLEGNKLIGKTSQGTLVQTIPPDYICLGTDDQGLPILKKVVLS